MASRKQGRPEEKVNTGAGAGAGADFDAAASPSTPKKRRIFVRAEDAGKKAPVVGTASVRAACLRMCATVDGVPNCSLCSQGEVPREPVFIGEDHAYSLDHFAIPNHYKVSEWRPARCCTRHFFLYDVPCVPYEAIRVFCCVAVRNDARPCGAFGC